MLLRASLLLFVLGALAACGASPGGKILADTPILPYQPPDADELAGIEDEEEEEVEEEVVEEEPPAPAPTPAPTPTPQPKAGQGGTQPAPAPAPTP